MLFRETAAVYCENDTEHTEALCGQNAEFWYVKAGGTYSNHRASEVLIFMPAFMIYLLQLFFVCLI
jgi:hypothetical protein